MQISPHHLERGLTLVETLAGAAILVVLIALLMPIAAAVSHRSNTAKCIGNLRHMHSGFIAYAGDHHGAIPPYRETWPQPDGTTKRGDFWSTKIKPYLSPNKEYLKCPAEKVIPSNHYGMNANISTNGAANPERIANTQLPSQRFLLADSISQSRITTTYFPTEGGFRHHELKINIVFFDGHAESLTINDLPIPANGYTATDAPYKAFFRGTL